MTAGVTWREATRADRRSLPAFECVRPAVKRAGRWVSERPWEAEVQGFVRALRPPAPRGEHYVLGEDEQGIAAAAVTCPSSEPCGVKLRALAVARRWRGHGLAGELVEETLARLAADAVGESALFVWGEVDPRNRSSREMLTRSGFALVEPGDLYDVWGLTLAP